MYDEYVEYNYFMVSLIDIFVDTYNVLAVTTLAVVMYTMIKHVLDYVCGHLIRFTIIKLLEILKITNVAIGNNPITGTLIDGYRNDLIAEDNTHKQEVLDYINQ